MEELESVAKYIKQHGRVSITDLAESSNRLINLNPDNAASQIKLMSEVSGQTYVNEGIWGIYFTNTAIIIKIDKSLGII